MKVAAIWREAALNVRTGTARAVTFAIALLLATGGLAAADLAVVKALEDQADQFQRTGASGMGADTATK